MRRRADRGGAGRAALVACVLGVILVACTPPPEVPQPASIEAAGTTDLVGATAAPFPTPLTVVVRDTSGSPLAGVAVTFSVTSSPPATPLVTARARVVFDGAPAPGSTKVVDTGDGGAASTVAVADEWVGTVGVTASVDTPDGTRSVSFRLTSRIPSNHGRFPADLSFPTAVGPMFDGSSIWVSEYWGTTVRKYRARDGALVGTFPTGDGPDDIALDAGRVWVANCNSDDVVALDTDDGTVLARFPIGDCPSRVVPAAGQLFVASKSGSLYRMDPATGTVTDVVAIGGDVEDMIFDGTSVWVSGPLGHEVVRLDDLDGALRVTRIGFSCPRGLADDGENLWVASPCFGTVTKLRKSDLANMGDIPVGPVADAVTGVEYDGRRVWVSRQYAGTIAGVDPATGTVDTMVVVGGRPLRMASDGTNLWAADFNGGLVAFTPNAG